MAKPRDITNERFGKLVGINFVERVNRIPYWKFKCDCGNEAVIAQWGVTTGKQISCGCVGIESRRLNGKKKFIHGARTLHPKEYGSWYAMRQRCNDPNTAYYYRYGGRGISYCKRWEDFRNFLEDMGPRPDGMSLDRINNDGNYEPSNCRWATMKEQSNNRRAREYKNATS